jgi:mannitol/fructose-specific phosphotransferase system IIA component (Ntr-type)
MKELISVENIKVKASAGDWKEAIEKAGELLLRSGKIKRNYIDNMIKAVTDMGPYIVLTPRFALAHAAPSSDVLESSISLITLESSVDFGSVNGPVNVILCLASVDSNSHISVLREVAEKLMIEGMIERLAACKSVQEAYLLINE